jgi:hypothetical protein
MKIPPVEGKPPDDWMSGRAGEDHKPQSQSKVLAERAVQNSFRRPLTFVFSFD